MKLLRKVLDSKEESKVNGANMTQARQWLAVKERMYIALNYMKSSYNLSPFLQPTTCFTERNVC